MLGKLLKYDFRSMWKQFAIIWPAALAIGIVNRFTIPWTETNNIDMMAVTTMLLLVAVLVAMGVVSLIFILQRFYKGLLGNEGYLMHTLPVRPWQLITSKLVCAVVVIIAGMVIAVLSMVVMLPLNWGDFLAALRGGMLGQLIEGFRENPDNLLFLLEFFLMTLASLASGVLGLYLSMAVGHLFQKHRVAMSVAAFIVLNILLTNLMALIGDLPFQRFVFATTHGSIWFSIGVEVLLGAVFFVGTNLILSKKLNLE